MAMVRGLALFLGVFSLMNLAGDLFSPGFDANIWWIDFRPLGRTMGFLAAAAATILLPAFALRPHAGPVRRWALIGLSLLLMVVAALNAGQYYNLLRIGEIRAAYPVPFSLLIALAFLAVLSAAWRLPPVRPGSPHPPREGFFSRGRLAVYFFALVFALIFPLAQILSFGMTDYRRGADVIVVFGARVYRSGRLSQVLRDRMRTAAELQRQGFAPLMLVSGGPGDGRIHETRAMRAYAVKRGVPARAVLLDPDGLNTRATVRNTIRIMKARGQNRATGRTLRVLAVSNYFHLPRIKMAYQRAGIRVYTVPARESYILRDTPWLLFRETAALWVYYLRGRP